MFRFVILGAAKIAPKFVRAVRLIENAQVTAVASKDRIKAQEFALNHQIPHFYGSYEEMLEKEKPDCAYIATTPNSHFQLTMLCLSKGIPVLCEKAMFMNEEEAKNAFDYAQEKHLFIMEAMWSRFLPATKKLKSWIQDDRIGSIKYVRCQIGFHAPEGNENRYRSKALGGGAARDILVYAFEQTDYVLGMDVQSIMAQCTWGETGVDLTDQVMIRYGKEKKEVLAELLTSFDMKLDDEMVLYGERGKIVFPTPHKASELFLYDEQMNLTDYYRTLGRKPRTTDVVRWMNASLSRISYPAFSWSTFLI